MIILVAASGCMFLGCDTLGMGAQFPIVKDTIKDSNKYKNLEYYCGFLNENGFKSYKYVTRNSIIENIDKEYSKEEQKSMVDTLDSLTYVEKGYIYFTMVYNAPLLTHELKLKFSIKNAKGDELFMGNTLNIMKVTQFNIVTSVNYTFLLYLKKSYNDEKNRPVLLTINFPDGAERIYKVK